MVRKKPQVIWDEQAREYLKQAIAYIRKDSPQNADKIKKDILASTRKLAEEPERQHIADKYRINNNGSYRVYELHKYRISYFVSKDQIRIVRIRHTGQEPLKY